MNVNLQPKSVAAKATMATTVPSNSSSQFLATLNRKAFLLRQTVGHIK